MVYFHACVNLSLFENASALRGLEQYQNVIANNIAASHVAGLKRLRLALSRSKVVKLPKNTHDRLERNAGSFP